MQQITVKSVEEKHSKDGAKTFYLVTDAKGAEMTTFDSEAMSLKPGTVIEGELEVSGKYINLKSFKIISQPTNGQRASYEADPKKQRSIERQKSVELAFENAPEEFTFREVLGWAEAIYRWIAEGKFPPVDTRTPKEAVKMGSEDIFPQEDKPVPPVAEDTSGKTIREPATIKTFGDLYTACKKDWPEQFPDRRSVWKELNVNSQEMITESPEECYRKILAVKGVN